MAASTALPPAVFDLPEGAALSAENGLLPFLHRHRRADVTLNATSLRRLDPGLVQAMVIAAQDWHLRGFDLRLTGLAPGHAARLAALGVTQSHLPHQVAP